MGADAGEAAMIFGDPQDFAIEAGGEPGLAPPAAVWGFMRVWCGGVPLGDIEERGCALYPSSVEFAWLSDHIDGLWDESLTGLDDKAAWDLLDGSLYGYHGDVEVEDQRTLDEMRRGWDRYSKFNFLTNWGESFDGYKSFIMSPPNGKLRILSRRLPAYLGLSVQVSRSSFQEACRRFIHWFLSEEAHLRERLPPP